LNPCEKNCSCERCKSCSVPVIKATDICNIPTAPLHSYGNFFQTKFITLSNNQPMPWSNVGQTSGITLDPDTVTIRVTQEGVYYIDYHVSGNLSPGGVPGNTIIATAIFVNGAEVNPIQTRYGAYDGETDKDECVPISGGTIIFIPANGTVQLRNISQSFRTCDGGVFLAASINLVKIN